MTERRGGWAAGARCEQPADAEVVRRCRDGETELFRVLVERYQDRVYGLAFHLLGDRDDASDAAQETFLRVYVALDRFDVTRPLLPWLLRIAANTCYGMLRKRPSGQFSLDAMPEGEVDARISRAPGTAVASSADPAERVARAASDAEIHRAVLALPEPYRTVTLLRYREEMSYAAIAEALEMPLGTVKTCLHRARARLKTALEERGEP